MPPDADLAVADLRVRTLTPADTLLLVEATQAETGPALWGPRPAGPYSLADAEAALRAWDPAGDQVSYGVLRGARLIGALALMVDGPASAELAYWVRPEERGHGVAVRAVQALTGWAHAHAGRTRIWLEIEPGNQPSLGVARRAGYRYERRLARHCRSWTSDDPRQDEWHDCLIWTHEVGTAGEPGTAPEVQP
ncbi:MAG TPA: GNAT family N-acetyltransferase [Pilimelia sp.]|nr:GNAT family N-acetyltransferase [Pilimelia sp.]